jgi:hypothetical protein
VHRRFGIREMLGGLPAPWPFVVRIAQDLAVFLELPGRMTKRSEWAK